jgi:hypothetical protein
MRAADSLQRLTDAAIQSIDILVRCSIMKSLILNFYLSVIASMLVGIFPVAGVQAQMSAQSDSNSSTSRQGMVVPSGAEIAVRTNEAIDSTPATEGRSFTGTVEKDVTGSSGQVLIPKGSATELTVSKVSSGGTTGSPEVTLALHAIEIGGHRYLVNSADVQQGNDRGIGKNKRTGEYIGGGAVLGTLLGAIAGGGKGAAIGAAAGAAAGGTAQVLTRGKEVKIPAESNLRFRLDQPLRLSSSSSY